MNIKRGLLFIIGGILILLLPSVSATPCGSVPTNNCTVSTSTTFTEGIYSLPDGIIITPGVLPLPFTLNCGNATLEGTGQSGVGITIDQVGLVTVRNCNVVNYGYAIYIDGNQTLNFIQDNNLSDNSIAGIVIENQDYPPINFSSSLNIIRRNVCINNKYCVRGLNTFANVIANNTVENSAVANAAAFYFSANSRYNLLFNNRVNGNGYGQGLLLDGISIDNLLLFNNFSGAVEGVRLDSAPYNFLLRNDLEGNSIGLHVRFSEGNIIGNNTLLQNAVGLQIAEPNGGSGGGVNSTGINNTIFLNNFAENGASVLDLNGGNDTWYEVDTSLGNHYSEYDEVSEGCLDGNFDNICDDAYLIDNNTGEIDPYPSIGFLGSGGFAGFPPPQFLLLNGTNVVIEEGEVLTIETLLLDPPIEQLTFELFNAPPGLVEVSPGVFQMPTNFGSAVNFTVTVTLREAATNLWSGQNVTVEIRDANPDCSVNERNGCHVVQNTVLSPGVKDFPQGIFVMNDSVMLDCNGAVLQGFGFGIVDDGIKVAGKSGFTVRNCTVNNYRYGLDMVQVTNAIVRESDFSSNKGYGIRMSNSHSNIIEKNKVRENKDPQGVISNVDANGMYMTSSNNNVIRWNQINANEFRGILVEFSGNGNVIMQNNIAHNGQDGIRFVSGGANNIINNSIINNQLIANGQRGIRMFSGASGNRMVLNNFIGNAFAPQATDTGSPPNAWNNASIGNYWDDYTSCVDANNDTVCDSPYVFLSSADNFPSAVPVSFPIDQLPKIKPVITIIGSPHLGSSVSFDVKHEGYSNILYVVAMSLGNTPGILLPTGEVVPLNDDFLLQLVLNTPWVIGLNNTIGYLSNQGSNAVGWNIPLVPGAEGLTVYGGVVTIDPANAANPIAGFSQELPITLLPA